MKRALMDILACPVCKGPLELKVQTEAGGEVLSGCLHCGRCPEDYPI
ncbi:MAG: Trm112 family protein, partial [Chloroflexi bacterium]|nr:Trm112 family protein [Chloroflexota bacterium]